jgi:arginine repressor
MTAVSPVTKAARHAQIAAILTHADPPVRSQEELADRLAQRGVRVTQATLSRDLEELGAVRLRGAAGALVYALPDEPGGPGSRPGGLPDGRLVPATAGRPAATGHEGGHADRHGDREGRDGEGRDGAGRDRAGPGGRDAPGVASGAQDARGEQARGEQARGQDARGEQARGQDARGEEAHGRSGQDARRGSGEGANGEPPGRLARVAAELLLAAEASANLVVLRTPAGAAQFLASVLDHASLPAVLGTVAGDDTVLVISRDPAGGDELARALLALAERRGPRTSGQAATRPPGQKRETGIHQRRKS